MSLGNWLWPSSLRQLFCAASTSLNTIARAVLFERQPLARIVRCRTVAKVLSMALLQILPRSGGMRSGREGRAVSDFKGRHFEGEIVLWAVRWYCRYGVSYRDLEQMMGERGISVDHSTIYRWVQKYAPEIEKRLRWQWRRPHSTSWR